MDEQLTIENLPNHTMVKIFKSLNEETILNAAKVCQRWEDIIFDAISLRSECTCCLGIGSELRDDDLTQFMTKIKEFPYCNIELYVKLPYNSGIKEILLDKCYQNLYNLRNIKVTGFLADFTYSLVKMFKKSVTHVTLVKVSKQSPIPEDFQVIAPNLTYLELESSTDFLNYINAERLHTLVIKNDQRNDEDKKTLEKFLNSCSSIKKLMINGYLPKFNIDEIKFKLDTLELQPATIDDLNNVGVFIESQKTATSILRLVDTLGDYAFTLMHAINNYRVSTLECFGICKKFGEVSHFKNKFIKNLEVALVAPQEEFFVKRDNRMDSAEVLKVIRKCPEITRIHFDTRIIDFNNIFVDDIFKKLKYIRLESIEQVPLRVQHYLSVEVLIVGVIQYADHFCNWLQIISFFPNAKLLEVHRFCYLPTDVQFQYFAKITQHIDTIKISYCSLDQFEFFTKFKIYMGHIKKLYGYIPKRRNIDELRDVLYDASFVSYIVPV